MDRERLSRMIRVIEYRGPDETGLFQDDNVGLAHNRLSIVDLDDGSQPMSNENGDVWIVFNGEIFNHVELREVLRRRGHRFRSRSDTEVIIHAYEEFGDDCVDHFNGQWSFVIWDRRHRRLFASRDRLGIRPLFYARVDGVFMFGSEVKSIFAHGGLPREIDPVALDQVLTFWCTVPPRSMFVGIRELPPGHHLIIEDGTLRIRQYWRMRADLADEVLSEEEWAERFEELLTDSVRLRLRADVRVGLYVSGGLDSSIVAGLVRQLNPEGVIDSFSIGFEQPEFDESEYQSIVSSHVETTQHRLDCGATVISGTFPDVVWHAEKTLVRTAPAPLFRLSDLVRECGYKVVLTGEGADEFFGGYDIFKESKIRSFWGAYPESSCRPLLLRRLYPYMPLLQSQSPAYLKRFFHVTDQELEDPCFSHLPRWNLTSKIKTFLTPDVRQAAATCDSTATLLEYVDPGFFDLDGWRRAEYLEAQLLMPGYILSSQGDRMSLAHGVEGRYPFLDHRVVECALSAPPKLKMKVLNEKYILKKMATDLVPSEIVRRSKQPYRAPDSASFFPERSRPLDYVLDMLSERRVHEDGIFRPSAVSKLVDKAHRGKIRGAKDNMAMTAILSTQILVDQYIRTFDRRITE